ncbi:hypothetical protein [Streptomyces silvensis]|uniref:Uncharacterized protein n=1 Tax=Streptomyces silvensis TaxID=1765722 RepID=A0A0W7XAK6_9ACTN|nr:hypothetical protein [Streptomyces silvensis]KUF19982.1 hypothetical protein AT728_27655 [Streptomyces silvensis]
MSLPPAVTDVSDGGSDLLLDTVLFTHVAGLSSRQRRLDAAQTGLAGCEPGPCSAERLASTLPVARRHILRSAYPQVHQALALVQDALAFVGRGLPDIGESLALIRSTLTLIGQPFASVRDTLTFISAALASIGGTLTLISAALSARSLAPSGGVDP